MEQLNAEQEGLRARTRELRAAEAREAEITREIAETQRRIDDLRGPSMDLERLRIASPCKASWDEMKGDDRVRYCGQCEKNVYNLSGMRRDEATALVRERTGEICVRMYRRDDGTVLTADCPVGARKKNVRRLAVLVAGGGALVLAGAGLCATSMAGRHVAGGLEPIPPPETVQGKPEAEPTTVGISSAPPLEPPHHLMMGAPARRDVDATPARPPGKGPAPRGPIETSKPPRRDAPAPR